MRRQKRGLSEWFTWAKELNLKGGEIRSTFQNVVVHRVIEGKAIVALSPTGPLSLLAPLEVIGGFYCELDFDLTYGEVAYDYLAGVPQPELATARF